MTDGKTVVIEGAFPTLNEFIDANRRRRGSWSGGNEMKRRDQSIISMYIRKQCKIRLRYPVYFEYRFYCKNTRADKDNIAGYFHKIFQDAVVACGLLPDDGWKYITGWSDAFDVDRKTPRVEVVIHEGAEKESV